MPRKAMVVDDSRAMRMILGRTLEKLGFQVAQAGNGKEALEVIGREHPGVSLAFVDWNMPEMNGLEFIQAVRSDPKYAQVQLVMVTTETQIEQMIRALDAGANEYIMKPFTEDVIADKLRMLGLIVETETIQ